MTDLPLGRFTTRAGRKGDVSVSLAGLSFRQTAKGPRYPYPDFGSDFIEALHRELTPPERRGLLRSQSVCPWCGDRLDGIDSGPVAVAIDIALQRIPPIHVDLEMPGIECPGCSRSVVMIHDRSVDSDLSDALIDAFPAGFAPS